MDLQKRGRSFSLSQSSPLRMHSKNVSGNPEGYAIKLTVLYQREDECRVFSDSFTAYIHTILEQQCYRSHSLFAKIVRYFRRTVLEDIAQGFPLVHRIAHNLSHQAVCHNLRVLHHQDGLEMDRFENSSRELQPFFLNLPAAEAHRTEQGFILDYDFDGVYYSHHYPQAEV